VTGVDGTDAAGPDGMRADGVLEELDGSPIRPAEPTRAEPWRQGLSASAALTMARPALWVYALVAFLARGGVVVLLLPVVVLPTFLGLSNFVGPTSVSADGPGPRLVAIVATGLAVIFTLAVGGTIIAAAGETLLLRAMVMPDEGEERRRGVFFSVPVAVSRVRAGVVRVASVRLVLLLPVFLAVAAAIPAWVAVAYRELTLPGDLAVPLVVRVLAGAPSATLLVGVAWLACEVVGGFAARRAVLLDATWPRALALGLADPLRAPVGTALTVLAALAVAAVALVPAAWAVSTAWDAARHALVDGASAPATVGSAVILTAAWVVALLLAGIAGAWRATLATAELLRRHPAPPAADVAHGAPAVRHASAGPPVA
jgi:hypothetical protein